jgi:3-oxoacyl-[acyl-carrier-protein] synthase-3
VRKVGIAGTASYLPERWMPAAEIAELSGIPEHVLIEKFGLRGKHIAAPDEHASDLSVRAAERLLTETGFDPKAIDVVMYFGSMWRDYPVWQASPHIAHRLGAANALAIEYDNVSHGAAMAVRVARNVLRAEEELQTILLVGASRESYLLDYTNERSRFMFSFGDGAVAALLVGDTDRNEVLGAWGLTDGSFSLQVKLPGGGSVDREGYRFLDVADPEAMKGGLDQVSLPNFVAAARGAAERSGITLHDVDFVCPLHTKRSMLAALLGELGMRQDQAIYLDDTGHMSGIDPLLGLDRAARDSRLHDGDHVLLLAAGTGYTWAAAVVRWGEPR